MGRSAIVLAAGLGTRMKSGQHKVLHRVCGKPMITHILDTLDELQLQQRIVVVGQQRAAVETVVNGRAELAVQSEQLGTGHAVQAAVAHLRQDVATTVVLYGDAPLITAETIRRLLCRREATQAAAVVLVAATDNPSGLGRVVLSDGGLVERIVEECDANEQERAIRLINTGIYAFETGALVRALAKLDRSNAQGEYYLTDTLAILHGEGRTVTAMQVDCQEEVFSVNDREQLAVVEAAMRRRLCARWMRAGVTMIDPSHTYLETDVQLGEDVVLYPGTVLEGSTVIEHGCVIGPNTRIQDSVVRAGARVEQSVVLQSDVGQAAMVGPFAYIRPQSRIGARVKVGDFVEVKRSTIGEDSKVSHLAYVGDADVGKRVNIGCGVITVNYDGKHKHRTVIGDDGFVGSNVNLIAPLEIGEGAYLCAGSTITDSVPADGFAIGRPHQTTKPQYVGEWRARRLEKDDGAQ